MADGAAPEDPLPPWIRGTLHLPGDAPGRYATFTLTRDGDRWTGTACVTAGRGACAGSLRLEPDAEAQEQLVADWRRLAQEPRCDVGERLADDREHVLRTPAGTWTGVFRGGRQQPAPSPGCGALVRVARDVVAMVRQAELATQLVPVGAGDAEGLIFTGPSAATLLRGELGRDAEGTWDPDAATIASLEAALPGWLRTARPRAGARIADHLSGYRRYYAGVVEHGRRAIFVSYFCATEGWRRGRITFYSDGGDCFFSVFYDPATATFFELRIHGSA